jgi:hypothetical protein
VVKLREKAGGRELLVGLGSQFAELDARAGLEPPRPCDQGLQCEQAGLFLAAVREELLLAANLAIPVEVLDAARPAPARSFSLLQLDAALAALAEEARSDCARVLDFVVVVVGIAAARAQLAEEAGNRDFRASVIARLLQVDRRRFSFDSRIERVADRHLIFGEVARHRYADVETFGADVGDT